MSFPIIPTVASAVGSLFTAELNVHQAVADIAHLADGLATAPATIGEPSFAALIAPVVPTALLESTEVAAVAQPTTPTEAVDGELALSATVESTPQSIRPPAAHAEFEGYESPFLGTKIESRANAAYTTIESVVVAPDSPESDFPDDTTRVINANKDSREEASPAAPSPATASNEDSQPADNVFAQLPEPEINQPTLEPQQTPQPEREPIEPVASVETDRATVLVDESSPVSQSPIIEGKSTSADLEVAPSPQVEPESQFDQIPPTPPKQTSEHNVNSVETTAPIEPTFTRQPVASNNVAIADAAAEPTQIARNEYLAVHDNPETNVTADFESRPPSEVFTATVHEPLRVISSAGDPVEPSPVATERANNPATPISTSAPQPDVATFETVSPSEPVLPAGSEALSENLVSTTAPRPVVNQLPPVTFNSPTTAEVALQNGFIALPAESPRAIETPVVTTVRSTSTATVEPLPSAPDAGISQAWLPQPSHTISPQPQNTNRTTPAAPSPTVDQSPLSGLTTNAANQTDAASAAAFTAGDHGGIETPVLVAGASSTPRQTPLVEAVGEEPTITREETATTIPTNISGEAPAVLIETQNDKSVTSSNATQPVETQIADNIVTETKWIPDQGEGEFRIRLDPEELGEVRVRLMKSAGGMKAEISAERQSTASLLSSQVEQIRTALRQAGVESPEVQVESHVISPQHSGEFHQPASQQNSFSHRPPTHYATRDAHQEHEEPTAPQSTPTPDRRLDLTI